MLANLLFTGSMLISSFGAAQVPDPEPVLRDSVHRPRPRPTASAPT